MRRFLLLACVGLLCFTTPAFTQATKPVSPTTAASLLKKRNTILLDVRTPEEFATGHLKGAQNLDFRASDFNEQVAKLDKSKTYVLYCASGNRSGQSFVLMQEKGLKKVVNAGAFKDLKAAGLTTVD